MLGQARVIDYTCVRYYYDADVRVKALLDAGPARGSGVSSVKHWREGRCTSRCPIPKADAFLPKGSWEPTVFSLESCVAMLAS